MIMDIIQTKTNFSLAWDMISWGEKIADAEAPFMPNMFLAEVRLPGDLRKLIFNPNDTSHGSSLKERLTFRLYDKDHEIGSIAGRTQKGKKLFGSYPYYEYIENGETYLVYEVGFGMKGLYLCFYKNDSLFCIVEKELTTINFKDKYKCYMADDSHLSVVAAFVIYYDTVSYGDILDRAVYSRKKEVVNTYQKELKARFDSDFIPRIKAMEGMTD